MPPLAPLVLRTPSRLAPAPLPRPGRRLAARPQQARQLLPGLVRPLRRGLLRLTLPGLALLAGCQATPAPTALDAPESPEVAQLVARLGPDPKLVSVVANGSESWEKVGRRLQQACRERYPALGPAPVVTMVDQREVRREVDLPTPAFSTTSPGASGPQNLLPPMPAAPRPVLILKKALATCAAPAAPTATAP